MQEDLCPALPRNAAILTILATERIKNVNPALEQIESLLCESSKLIASAIRQESVSRKTLVAPAFNRDVRKALKKEETTTKLFGDKTVELDKE